MAERWDKILLRYICSEHHTAKEVIKRSTQLHCSFVNANFNCKYTIITIRQGEAFAADQHLYFHIESTIFFLNMKFQSILYGCTARHISCLVENLEDGFSHDAVIELISHIAVHCLIKKSQ